MQKLFDFYIVDFPTLTLNKNRHVNSYFILPVVLSYSSHSHRNNILDIGVDIPCHSYYSPDKGTSLCSGTDYSIDLGIESFRCGSHVKKSP